MLTDACERLLGQAARTEQKDEGSKAAAVPLLNLKLFFDLDILQSDLKCHICDSSSLAGHWSCYA